MEEHQRGEQAEQDEKSILVKVWKSENYYSEDSTPTDERRSLGAGLHSCRRTQRISDASELPHRLLRLGSSLDQEFRQAVVLDYDGG